MKYKLVLGTLAGVLAITASAPAFALGETESQPTEDKSIVDRVGSTVRKTVDTTVNKTSDLAESANAQSDANTERKATLREELQQMRAERKQKLEGRRLAQCQNRQERINALLDKSAANGKERLSNIQQFEERVREFYEKKNLSSDKYLAASEEVDAKEDAAKVALDTMAAENYDCSSADASKPAEAINAMRTSKHEALKAYRASVVELIHVVKAAFAATQTETSEGEAQ